MLSAEHEMATSRHQLSLCLEEKAFANAKVRNLSAEVARLTKEAAQQHWEVVEAKRATEAAVLKAKQVESTVKGQMTALKKKTFKVKREMKHAKEETAAAWEMARATQETAEKAKAEASQVKERVRTLERRGRMTRRATRGKELEAIAARKEALPAREPTRTMRQKANVALGKAWWEVNDAVREEFQLAKEKAIMVTEGATQMKQEGREAARARKAQDTAGRPTVLGMAGYVGRQWGLRRGNRAGLG
ncbi:unnamed protein product, partial [Discosporangium mesarthrocarpum]